MAIDKINRVVIDEAVRQDIDSKATKVELQTVKQDLENKINAVVSNMDWKESVDTFADLGVVYPNPDDGWTVNTKDTDITYRYNGTKWVAISGNSIPLATESVDGKMSKEDKAKLNTIEEGAQVNLTAQETLELLKTVDGVDSGLDADTLRGLSPSDFATYEHLHDGRYFTQTEINTKLSGKSNVGHKHSYSDVIDFKEAVEDTIGNAIENSSSITMTYDNTNSKIKADVNVDNSTIEVDTTGSKIRVKDSGITDSKIGNRTISDTAVPSTNTGNLTSIVSWLANRIKVITGKSSWRDTPSKNLEDLNTHINSASPHTGHALTSTAINTGDGLIGGGDLSISRTISIANDGVTDNMIGSRTVDDSTTVGYDNTGTLTQMLSWIVKSIKEIKGGVTNWYDSASSNINSLYSTLSSHIGSGGSSHSRASQSKDGFMSSVDKAKLDTVEENANAYEHPSTHSADMIVDGTNNKAFTSDERNKLSGISTGANKVTTSTVNGNIKIDGVESKVYTHPSTHSLDEITDTIDKKIMTSFEREKLAGIEENANNYKHPSTHSISMITETTTQKIMTSDERNKLSGISTGANKTESSTTNGNIKIDGVETKVYEHPTSHPASMITESTTRRFVTDSQISSWDNKQNALGYTPENVTNKNKANGYVGLDSNGKIPLSYIPDTAKQQTYVVLNATERNALVNLISGDKCFETSTGDTYIYDGSNWIIQADADWANVNLEWANVNGKPSSTASDIDDAVSKRHTHSKSDSQISDAVDKKHSHSNLSVLNKITQSGSELSFDLSKFVTQSDLGNAGYGDMIKSDYDTDGDGIVNRADVADSVDWSNVKNKPSTYSPASHSHSQADISDLDISWTAISGKPTSFNPTSHTHTKSQITDFAHTHTKSQITDLSLDWIDITDKPSTFTPSSHTHTKSEITDLSLDWVDITGKPSTFTPSTHTHTRAQISDFAHNHDSDYAKINHTHSEYAGSNHNHDGSYLKKSGDSVSYLDFGNFRLQGNTTDNSLDIIFLG